MDSAGQENGSIFLGGRGCPRGCGVPEPVVSGLTLPGSIRDGSTDSGREQVPTGVLNARVDWCVGWTRTGRGKCGHPGC